MNKLENIFPFIGKRGQILEIPAPLAGHLAPHAHILSAIVVNGDTAEVFAVHISSGPRHFRPGTMGQAQGLYNFFRCVVFGGK